MSVEAVKNAVSPYASQAADFASKNWAAFRNATVQYGTKVYETEVVQKVVTFATPYMQSVARNVPDWAKFSWSTATAVTTFIVTISALFAIGKFGPAVPGSAK